ncbi:hypothetical protein D6817_00480 [Candidatus Pacearchaeota archaeon]|nr:MAG: hypothetical protein D6817_00480 [Candidatus Pacearchaeota archaeon]
MQKRGQVTIFIIVAVAIVAGVLTYLLVQKSVGSESVPSDLKPVFDTYLSCIRQEARNAVDIALTQAGYIEPPEYDPPSDYAPFSSELNFLGIPVPFWMYQSGNGLIKEQIPTEQEMERQIGDFIQERLKECDLQEFLSQGIEVEVDEPIVNVNLEDDKMRVDVRAAMSASDGETSARKTRYKVEIPTRLKRFYKVAKEIYQREKEEGFLEQYAIDTLNLNAPVDGVEIQCAPKVWSTREVVEGVKRALADNFATIKFSDKYVKGKEREYFLVDMGIGEQVSVLYFPDWPSKIEVSGEGVSKATMVAKPIGAEQGLGVLGMCYVPYHFVYDISVPVLVQIYDGEESFQFPIVVLVDNNLPRQIKSKLNLSASGQGAEFDLCKYRTQTLQVNVFDSNFRPVNADLSFGCFEQRCPLGKAKGGTLVAKVPQCVNGFVYASADGYVKSKAKVSTNRENSVDVLMERKFPVRVELFVNGRKFDAQNSRAVVSFLRDDGFGASLAIPESGTNVVELPDGNYEIRVYVYSNSKLSLPPSTQVKCVQVPKQGLLGVFGAKEENCFNVQTPATSLNFALIGGGKLKRFLTQQELSTGRLNLFVPSFGNPSSIDELQRNFVLFGSSELGLEVGGGNARR